MTETLKPGTRCECCAEECPNDPCHVFTQDDADAGITNQREAVRVVTVRDPDFPLPGGGCIKGGERELTMCGPCAKWHEKGAKP